MELLLIFTSLFVATLVATLVKRRGIIEWASGVATAIVAVESIVIAIKVAAQGNYTPSPFFSVDALGAIVMLIIACVGLAATIYSIPYLRQETAKQILGFGQIKQYFILLNLFLIAMFLAISTSSPILTWISVEATTLSTAFLISFYNKPSAMEAAWKYLIINSIGLLLAFFGTLLYFTSIDSVTGGGVATWTTLATSAAHLNPVIAKIAFVLVLIGYGTKVGLVPMHTWLPDAHSKAPAPVSALLSGVMLNVAFVVVLRFKIITDLVLGSSFSQNLLMLFGMLSILVAALIIIAQKNYKRLLAYSSIENMGVIALGFGFGGLGVFAAMLHMIYHAFIKSALFLSAGTIFLTYSSTKIAQVRGALAALPATSIMFFAGFLAITGIPPFGIFFSKIFIFSAGISTHPIITVIAMLFMGILFIGFFNHVTAMIFGKKPTELQTSTERAWLIIPPLALIAVVVYLSFSIPPFLQTLLHEIVSLY